MLPDLAINSAVCSGTCGQRDRDMDSAYFSIPLQKSGSSEGKYLKPAAAAPVEAGQALELLSSLSSSPSNATLTRGGSSRRAA